ncbi:MAG: hypothetical protein PVI21_00065 [Candidatus Woesebacteria bacterium]|jgi:hypothetical protein
MPEQQKTSYNLNKKSDQLKSFDDDVAKIEQAEKASQEKTEFFKPSPSGLAQSTRPDSFKGKLKKLLKSRKFWILTALSLTACLIAAWFVQPSRLWLVNLLGQRTSLNITVSIPADGKQEASKLQNAIVMVNGKEYKTNQEGVVNITDQSYGQVDIDVTKNGYESVNLKRTLDFDPFFYVCGGRQADEDVRNIEFSLTSVGIATAFKAVDWLSGQPITSGEYQVGDLKVKPDDTGLVEFKAPPSDNSKVSLTSIFEGEYIDKTFEVDSGAEKVAVVEFVPAGRQYFTSKKDGALGIYSSNIDGSDQKLVISGTGKETDYTPFVVSPDGKYGLLASTRDGAKDDKHALLQYLYIVDLEKRLLTKIDEAHYFAFTDWSDDVMVYQKQQTANITDENSIAQLRAVDVSTGNLQDIATAASFGRKIVGLQQVAYVQRIRDKIGDTYTTSFNRYDLKNSSAKELATGVVDNNVVQASFDVVGFQTQSDQKWHEYNLNASALKDSAQPTASTSKAYINGASPNNKNRLIVDRIDGKFTIIAKSIDDGAEKQIFGDGALTGQVRWLQDNVITFRIVSDQQTADYAVSIKGGEPKKISDVTAIVDSQNIRDINTFEFY